MPTKPKILPSLSLSRTSLALAAVSLLPSFAAARKDDAVIVAPPVMVSVGADTPTWTTTDELIAYANEGDPYAMFQYAQLLEAGDQVERDDEAAFEFYRRAAAKGQPEALFRVGKVLHDGLLGRPQDRPRAFEYYQKAALAEIPEATHNIGAMLVSARGVKRDYSEGLAWLIVAAEQGADPTSAETVRKRIKSRPEWIEEAEQRAEEIRQEIANATPEDLLMDAPKPEPDLAPKISAPTNPTIAAPKIATPTLPGLSPSTPKPSISAPAISLPQPKPKPPAESSEE